MEYKYTPKTKEELIYVINKEFDLQGYNADLNCINTSAITDMSKLFKDKEFNGDISQWNVGNVKNMIAMFKDVLHTLTVDNGKEFAKHDVIAQKLGIDVFFAHPYHSWERGANENTNGLIRQYFPKGSDFDSWDDQQIESVMNAINNRPRKRLGFRTPLEVAKSFSPGFS